MAFSYERLFKDDKKKHNIEHIIEGHWLIDEVNNMFIVHAGGQGDPGGDIEHIFELHAHGQIIKFYVLTYRVDDQVRNYVTRISLPESSRLNIKEVMAIIDDALYTFGRFGSWKNITGVQPTHFPAHLTGGAE